MRARPLPVLIAAAAVALGLALTPSGARADGDPASDVLLQSSIYTPVAQKISPGLLRELQETVREADAGGFPVRVALILDRTDLGAVPQLFGHPVKYVKLLTSELFYAWKGAVIAVQPSGIGVQNVKPLAPAQDVADTITIKAPSTADGLAQAAIDTIHQLGGKGGNKITFTPSADGPGGGGSSSSTFSTTRILGGVLIVVLVLLFIGQLVLRRRGRKPADPGS